MRLFAPIFENFYDSPGPGGVCRLADRAIELRQFHGNTASLAMPPFIFGVPAPN